MVLTLAIPLRKVYGLEGFITARHLDNMAQLLLATGLMVAYGYVMETFMGWYSGNRFEIFELVTRALGPYAFWYWVLIFCNVLVPQVFWFRSARRSIPVLFIGSLLVNLGMWVERFVIIVVSLNRDFMTSSWRMYFPTFWDWATLSGSIGLFLTLMFLFIRVLPAISIFELREMIHEEGGHRQ
jgi:molybdopterin-containing oxidoreductase family membrane subunit